jgi:vitamin B12 transporter
MHRLVLPACLAIALIGSARADESSSTTNVLPATIVTGTRIPTDIADTPTTISVITRDQIEAQQDATVADVLRDVAGVDVVTSGQPGSESSVFIRGADSSQTLVLIDGVRVNNPFNNAYNFAFLPVDNIDHIEVMRGPQSTLYGSEALGGVINIVTKAYTGPPTGSVMVEGGSDNSLLTRAAFAMSSGKLSLSGEGSYFTSDNERLNSDTYTWDGSGRANYQILDNLSVSLLGTYTKSFAGSPGDDLTDDPNNYLREETTLVALTVNARLADGWTSKLTFGYNHDRTYFDEPVPNPSPNPPPAPPTLYPAYAELTTTDREQVDFQNIFKIIDPLQLLVGGTFDRSIANDFNTYGTVDREVDDGAGYAELDYTPIPRLTATAGGRVDDYSDFGTHGTYRFGLRGTTPDTETILRTSVGTGFRAPSVVQLSPGYGGNPDLLPEENLGWDAGIEQPLANNQLHVGTTYFQDEFKNLIISSNVPPPVYSELVNAGRARTIGLENFIAWTPLTNLTLRGAYTWLPVARDLTANEPLIRRPQHSGSASVEYRFLKRFTADLNTVIVGARRDTNFDYGQNVTDPTYWNVTLGLRYDVCKYFSIFGHIDNLFDDHYSEAYGYPALHRTFWGGGVLRF